MKNHMTTTRTLLLGLIASGAIVGAAVAAGPQGHKDQRGPGHNAPRMMQLDEATIEVAKATAERMSGVRETAFEAIRASARTGVDSITALGKNEAPAEAVQLAAAQSRDAILTTVIDADAQIVALANETIADLRANGAPSQQIMAVLRVRDRSLQALHQGAMRGQLAVGKAARGATGEGDEFERPQRPQRPEGRRPGMGDAEGERPEARPERRGRRGDL